MKNIIEESVSCNEQVQTFLSWVSRKSLSVKLSRTPVTIHPPSWISKKPIKIKPFKKLVAIRAFYFCLVAIPLSPFSRARNFALSFISNSVRKSNLIRILQYSNEDEPASIFAVKRIRILHLSALLTLLLRFLKILPFLVSIFTPSTMHLILFLTQIVC